MLDGNLAAHDARHGRAHDDGAVEGLAQAQQQGNAVVGDGVQVVGLVVVGRLAEAGDVDGQTREAGVNQIGDHGRPERVRAAQAVDEVDGQAGSAGGLPAVEDSLAVDIGEGHLGGFLFVNLFFFPAFG